MVTKRDDIIEKIFEKLEKFLDAFFGAQTRAFNNFINRFFVYRYEEANTGMYAVFHSPERLLKAAKAVRERGYDQFDCFSPFPIHGLEYAMGYQRSKLPYVTFFGGLTGFILAVFVQTISHENIIPYTFTRAIDAYPNLNSYPLNYGGKPTFSWPAMIPISFELTVLFAGLSTVITLMILSRMPKPSRIPLDERITDDKFVLWISGSSKNYNEDQIRALFQELGAEEIKKVGEK
ncbi:MAG: DUF3341 domain-containing protein [Leptospiraceae bacterium]|nr:DUF3341 domain-containing protein [Leptospiraceae bacterium]MDW7974999.1 DUF3341 domain-containing protein [Leptospiraceae bacterium]